MKISGRLNAGRLELRRSRKTRFANPGSSGLRGHGVGRTAIAAGAGKPEAVGSRGKKPKPTRNEPNRAATTRTVKIVPRSFSAVVRIGEFGPVVVRATSVLTSSANSDRRTAGCCDGHGRPANGTASRERVDNTGHRSKRTPSRRETRLSVRRWSPIRAYL